MEESPSLSAIIKLNAMTETAIAVLIEAVDASSADKTGLILARGPAIASKAALIFDASVDQAAEKAAKYSQLTATGIVPRETA
jgi:hypothetical protein